MKASQVFVVGLAATFVPTDLLACEFRPFEPYLETAGPEIPGLRVARYEFVRGCGSDAVEGDCADVGRLVIELETTDGESVPSGLGALVTVTTGVFPVAVGPGRLVAIRDSALSFLFGDGNGQPAIDATVVIRAVDEGGVVGEPTEPTRIHHAGGNPDCGCAALQSSSLAALIVFFWGFSRRVASNRAS